MNNLSNLNNSNNSNLVDLNEKFPCIGNKNKHESASKKYSLIETSEVINLFERRGFEMSDQDILATGSKTHGTHVIPFRHNALSINQGGVETRAFLRTSHDRTVAFTIIIGAMNFSCANGLYSGTKEFEIKHRHMGLTLEHIETVMLEEAIQAMKRKNQVIEFLKNTKVDPQHGMDFLNKVINLRCKNVKNFEGITQKTMDSLLMAQQDEFKEDSYFALWNKIDENLFTTGQGLGNKAERINIEVMKRSDDNKIVNRKLRDLTNPKAILEFKQEMEKYIMEYVPSDLNQEKESSFAEKLLVA